MAQGQLVLPIRGIEQVVYTFKPQGQVALLDPASVMVADNQMLLSLKLPEVFLWRFFIAEHEVAEYKYGVIVTDDFAVPILNKSGIHLFDTAERPIAETDNVAMPKVEITCEEYHQHSPRFLC